MKRLFAAFTTGSVLFAGSFGFAQFQAINNPGLAAQGSAFTDTCEDMLNVTYSQTNGVVVGVEVDQVGGINCDGLPVNVKILNAADAPLNGANGSNGTVNGPDMVVNITDVAAIHRAVVTITNE